LQGVFFPAVTAAFLLLSACSVARMDVPPELAANAEGMRVKGLDGFKFKERLFFGPFKVEDVHRSWTRTTSWGSEIFSQSASRQKYEFTIAEEGGATWHGQCAAYADAVVLEIEKFLGGTLELQWDGYVLFIGELRDLEGDKSWRLAMGQTSEDYIFSGVLRNDEMQISIIGSHQLAGSGLSISSPSGYIFSLRGRKIAAVEVINKGFVWIHSSVTPELRGMLSAACAALLLYEDISDQR
jgi:hypothetical protein